MNILVVHNTYQKPGGEDQVFLQETQVLEEHGHKVIKLEEHNDRVSGRTKLQLIGDTIWNSSAYHQVQQLIRAEGIDVVHAHNTFPLLSPAIYHAATALDVPVIQTLHNYRLICPAATLFRDGHICQDCVGRVPLPAVIHGCYRGSRTASAVTAVMLTGHRLLGTYSNAISRYIALSRDMQQTLIGAGFPAEKLVVKPNFLVNDPGVGKGQGRYCLFAGRLTEEKGIRTLLECWRYFSPTLPLQIVGQGPLQSEVESVAAQCSNVTVHPWLSKEKLSRLMQDATVLVLPSLWYEPFPMTILEAFATGLPVIASRLGTMESVIEHGRTGLHFESGNAVDLARQVELVFQDADRLLAMRRNARQEFEAKYTGEINYKQLLSIYRGVLSERVKKAA